MNPRPLKVILDTNILLSSLWGGKPGMIIELWDEGRIIVLVSQQIPVLCNRNT